jgi:hypothetical protein
MRRMLSAIDPRISLSRGVVEHHRLLQASGFHRASGSSHASIRRVWSGGGGTDYHREPTEPHASCNALAVKGTTAVAFVASGEAGYDTGQVPGVDGGLAMMSGRGAACAAHYRAATTTVWSTLRVIP